LPFEVVVPGFHYRQRLEGGTVDIYFESDNGKINPRSAPPELLANFFATWSGDVARAQTITDSLADWSDADDDARPNGAESSFYASLNVAPRNAPLGVADLPFVRGIGFADFRPRLSRAQQEPVILQTIDNYLTDASTDIAVNINFAPEFVLQSIPGLGASRVAGIMAARRDRPFADMNAVQVRTGLNPESPAWRFLTVGRSSPTVLTLTRMNSGLLRSERRVTYTFSAFNFLSGTYEPKSTLGRIEKNVFPDFL
jgi:DNA uptake protein ComE-like DNA-binding protein